MANLRAGLMLLGAGALGFAGQGLAGRPAQAQTYSVVHAFTGPRDGAEPMAGVTPDSAGNLYGVTEHGGSTASEGAVYKIDPSGRVSGLHSFDCATGCLPYIEPLTLVGTTLYGSTAVGGPSEAGALFSINTDGTAYTVLHYFIGKDGDYPTGALAPVPGHGFIGVTEYGGNTSHGNQGGSGVLFSLNRFGRYRKLHDFADGADGKSPGAVLADSTGTVYGSARGGGGSCTLYSASGCGVLFKFDLTTGRYSVLYRFTGTADGAGPVLGSVGPDGTLYGVTVAGSGAGTFGSLFSFAPATGVLTTLATFNRVVGVPSTGPTLTSKGRLVGATSNALYIYSMGHRAVLQQLSSIATGQNAFGQPVIAADGSIVGTTWLGGDAACPQGVYSNSGCGVVYRYGGQ